MKDKIESLQLLRALAALMVVVTHLWGMSETKFASSIGLGLVGSFGVDMFFILSGFIMCYTIKENSTLGVSGAFGFLIRRVERIYPVFIIILIPYLMKYMLDGGSFDLYVILGNILLLPTFNGDPDYRMLVFPSWTLVYEMFFYVILSLFMVFSINKKSLILMTSAFIVLMVVLTNVLSLKGERLGWVNFSYMIGDTLMINFVIGCLFSLVLNYTTNLFDKLSFSVITTSSLIVIFLIAGVVLSKSGVPRLYSFGVCSFFVFVLFITLGQCSGKVYRLFVYIGNASYSIYLTHIFFISINKFIVGKFGVNQDVLGLVSSIVAISFGCLFYSFVEKNIMLIFKKRRASIA
ncbi:acyltransferase family protein [Serratia proteamaculans]|uniref:acyltransferase family protein n=1 Tax=Serratia proteamaculans TaxID=28151 RepID=UPI0021BD007E|nr:acyltransferase [Serratia proteamaculans]